MATSEHTIKITADITEFDKSMKSVMKRSRQSGCATSRQIQGLTFVVLGVGLFNLIATLWMYL